MLPAQAQQKRLEADAAAASAASAAMAVAAAAEPEPEPAAVPFPVVAAPLEDPLAFAAKIAADQASATAASGSERRSGFVSLLSCCRGLSFSVSHICLL